MSWETLKKAAFWFFGTSLDSLADKFESIRLDLENSGLKMALKEYVYVTFFVTFIVMLSSILIFTVLLVFVFKSIIALFFALTVTTILTVGTLFFFYMYPSLRTKGRIKRLESGLAFVSLYLASITASGVAPTNVFKILSKFKEHKEVSEEAWKIYRDMVYFGMDLERAVR